MELSRELTRLYSHLILTLDHVLWHATEYDESFECSDIGYKPQTDHTMDVVSIYDRCFRVCSLHTLHKNRLL